MPGLYVHIPFCRAKCAYCDFASTAGRGEAVDAYIAALAGEAARYGRLAGTFDTLYAGGGTPSLLSETQLAALFAALKPLTGPLAALRETTFEANPESVTERKAAFLRAAGINRISMGLQAAQERLLKKLGRIAMPDDFIKAFGCFRKAGFDNISGDLMSGLPGQTLDDFSASLELLLGLGPEHISLYPLEIHEDTPLGRQGIEEEPEAAAEMYGKAVRELARRGYERYEISNFARPGRASVHNLNYWEQGSYLGLGTAAASYIEGERWTNTADLDEYLAAARAGVPTPSHSREKLSGRRKAAERIMLGLRKTAGIELESDIFIEFNKELARLKAQGLIEISGLNVKIRGDRFYQANAVFREFV